VIVLGRAADLIMPDTGLETGDVIHALNATPVTDMATLRAAVLNLKTGDPVVLQVERSDGLTYLSFEME
jgi:S1-C subfamily serine protease